VLWDPVVPPKEPDFAANLGTPPCYAGLLRPWGLLRLKTDKFSLEKSWRIISQENDPPGKKREEKYH
jgi:hypothetical protein